MPATTLQRVILEILRKSDGEFSGKTRLYKACYFAHLYYFESAPGILSECDFARLPQGPGIHQGDAILDAYRDQGLLDYELFHEGPYAEYRYRLSDRGRESLGELPSKVDSAIQRAVDFVRDKTATQLSQFTHEYSKAWNEGNNGDVIEIHIDVIPDTEYYQRQKELAKEKPFYDQLLKVLEG
jgi:hypothetical protein